MEHIFPFKNIALPPRIGERLWYYLGRGLVRGLAGILFDLDVSGFEGIPPGAKILASNHPTTIDPVLMTALVPEQVGILISETLFKLPFLGAALRWGGHIRVIHAAGGEAYEESLARLREGQTVGIYPEGALSPVEGGLGRLHTGAVRLALASGCPLIPVGIAPERGKVVRARAMVDGREETGAWYLGGQYVVRVGEPFWPRACLEDRAQVRRETRELSRRIAALAAESEARVGQRALGRSRATC